MSKKETVTLDKEQRDRMAGLSGEQNSGKAPKFVVPLIRFDGNRGEFRKIFYNQAQEKEEAPIKKPVSFVILKKRRLLSSYSPTVSYFSTEHNSKADPIQVFSNTAGQITHEFDGTTDDARAKFPTLKTHEVLYVLFDGEICRFEVKGGSLANYYSYLRELQESGKHSFEVTTVCRSESKMNEAKFKYHAVTFESADLESTFDEIEQHQNVVTKALAGIDAYFAAKKTQNKAPVSNADTAANAEYAALGADIDVDKIPF